MSAPVRYEVDGIAARLTLDSPANRNALSSALVAGLTDGLRRAAEDPDVRVVVLGHTGGTFCAGADLSEAAAAGATPEEAAAARTGVFLDLLRAIARCPRPVVAAVDGHVRAGGMGLVAACDLALAGPASTFALTEVRLGLAAAMVSVPLQLRVEARALTRLLLTGEKIDAAEAARIGLLTRAVDELDPAVAELVETLRACSPQGLAETKALCSHALLRELDAQGLRLAEVSGRLFVSAEAAEGLTAFLDKRPPAWAR